MGTLDFGWPKRARHFLVYIISGSDIRIKMQKATLIVLLVVAAMVTMGDAGYNCNNWKKMTGPCEGCVFTSGDMAGKCKRTGQYHDKSACVKAGGTWCL